jgi:hypothetical protein
LKLTQVNDEQIRSSLKQFGWTVPVLAREDGDGGVARASNLQKREGAWQATDLQNCERVERRG